MFKSGYYEQKLHELIHNPFIMEDKDYETALLKIIYDANKENTQNLFLHIQELDRKRIAAELLEWKIAAESTMNNFIGISRRLMEKKTSKQAKDYLNFIFSDDEAVVYLINFCKIYFKKGSNETASNNGKWYFEKFKNSLLKTKEKWLPEGDSYDWVKNHGHEEYIKLVLDKHSK